MENIEIKYNENLKLIGATIKRNRKKKNISQKSLAEYLEVTDTTIGRYEKAQMEIPASCLGVISEHLEFNPVEYFTTKQNLVEILDEIADVKKKDLHTSFTVSAQDLKDVIIDANEYSDLEHVKWLAHKLSNKPKWENTEIVYQLVDGILMEISSYNASEKAFEQFTRIEKYWKLLKKNSSKTDGSDDTQPK